MPRQDLRSTYFSPHVVFVSRFFFIVILGRLEIWFVTLWLILKYPKQKRNVSETVQLNTHPLQNTTWPLGDTATVRLTPFVTGDEAKTEWGNVIRKVCFECSQTTLKVTIFTFIISLLPMSHQSG